MQIHITQDDPKNIFIERYYDISLFLVPFGPEKSPSMAGYQMLN